MNRFDLIVHGSSPQGVRQGIGIVDGIITEIGENISGSATREIDAGDDWLVPGFIDSHVHFNEPGRADWEGLHSGSLALAAAGGTTFFDMPLNSSPPVITRQAFETKRRLAEQRSHLDFALWAGLTPESLGHMESMGNAGAVGFKAFMCPSGLDEFSEANPSTLRAGMQIAARIDLPVAVHAEDPNVIQRHRMAHPDRGVSMTDW